MNVQEYLTKNCVAFDSIHHADADGAQRMAHAVGTSGHRVAKTVLLRADAGFTYVVAVLPATKRVDLDRL